MLAYSIYFSLSDLLHSVWQTLGPSTSLQITRFHFFSWLSNIPLYICATSSLSIHFDLHQNTTFFKRCSSLSSPFPSSSSSSSFSLSSSFFFSLSLSFSLSFSLLRTIWWCHQDKKASMDENNYPVQHLAVAAYIVLQGWVIITLGCILQEFNIYSFTLWSPPHYLRALSEPYSIGKWMPVLSFFTQTSIKIYLNG